MSDDKEELEFELQKLHRTKVEQELEEIRQELSNYYERQETISIKRRRENIYVLFALAIIGAFFSLIPRSPITIDTPFLIGFGIFTLASVGFLIIKVNTLAISESSYTSEIDGKINIYSEYLFAFSINGSLLLIIAVSILNIFSIQVTTIVSSISSFLSSLISAFLVYYFSRYIHVKSEAMERVDIERRVMEIFFKFRRVSQADSKQEILNSIDNINSDIEDLFNHSDRVKELTFDDSEEISNLKEFQSRIDDIDEYIRETNDLEPIQAKLQDMTNDLPEMFKWNRPHQNKESKKDTIKSRKKRLQDEYEKLVFGDDE